jgi:poly-gamma-glutamate synthesis protein (capsule biosynthesis protein)
MAVYDEPEFMALVNLIRDADVGFVNMESNFLDDKNQVPYRPIGQASGIERHHADNIAAQDLQWMGFDICSTAMNHSVDYGYEGILSTKRVLDEAGFIHAGIGATLSEATLPGYMQTKKGAVAIISSYSPSFWALQATDPSPLAPTMARPGVNGVRTNWVVDPQTFEKMKTLSKEFAGPLSAIYSGIRPADPWWEAHLGAEAIMLSGCIYVIKGKKKGTYAYTQPRQSDLERNVRAVKGAAGMADWVIYAVHDHTRDGKGMDSDGAFYQRKRWPRRSSTLALMSSSVPEQEAQANTLVLRSIGRSPSSTTLVFSRRAWSRCGGNPTRCSRSCYYRWTRMCPR